ncbi:MAG: hypothetical protein ACUVRL_05935 [Candidatus Saccharicenans sp.]
MFLNKIRCWAKELITRARNKNEVQKNIDNILDCPLSRHLDFIEPSLYLRLIDYLAAGSIGVILIRINY